MSLLTASLAFQCEPVRNRLETRAEDHLQHHRVWLVLAGEPGQARPWRQHQPRGQKGLRLPASSAGTARAEPQLRPQSQPCSGQPGAVRNNSSHLAEF